MNVYDAERMADVLATIGYEPTDRPEDADILILNTCHIREKAAEKMYSDLGRARQIKEARAKGNSDGRPLVVAVAGCVAQADGEEIFSRAPYVDMVFGPQTYHRLPEMVAQMHRQKGTVLDTDFPLESKFDFLPEQKTKNRTSAFLTVQEGCDKFCTFCVVPYTRGAEYSRPAQQVLDEARNMAALGVREITLLGQNVNNYHGEAPVSGHGKKDWTLGRLIAEIAEIEGLDRIRYTTSYPADVDEDLIYAHGNVPALMPYLHLPVQSGSDRILTAMNRRQSADDYRRLVDNLRVVRSDLAFSSDFIVGFPGENDRDFKDTLNLIDEIGFVGAYSFKYSKRIGTPAAAMEWQVPEPVKKQRLKILQDLLKEQQSEFNEDCVGTRFPVLIESHGRHPGQLIGRSPYMQAVHVNAPDVFLGKISMLQVDQAYPNSLAASLVVNEQIKREMA